MWNGDGDHCAAAAGGVIAVARARKRGAGWRSGAVERRSFRGWCVAEPVSEGIELNTFRVMATVGGL